MASLHLPLTIGPDGETVQVDASRRAADMLGQVLLTLRGERVNRPDFGAGIVEMVFTPASSELAAAHEFAIRAELARWLGDVVRVNAIAIAEDGEQVNIQIAYTTLNDGRDGVWSAAL